MKKNRLSVLAAVVIVLTITAVVILQMRIASGHGHHSIRTVNFQSMGTVCSVSVYGSEEQLNRAFKAGKAEIDRVNNGCSLYDPESELVMLNSAAGEREFICSRAMWFLIKRAQQAYFDSDGEFDITVKPLMDLWGFYRKNGNRIPSDAEIAEVKKRVGFDKLILNDKRRSIRFSVPGMALDLGGIAKGYAADLALTAIIAAGGESGVIDIGGNLRFLPAPPPGKEIYRVAIRDPRNRNKVISDQLDVLPGRAVATSGDYERGIELNGERYGHIISPKTGKLRKYSGVSVTVVADTAVDADVFSTICYIGGREAAGKLQQLYPGIRVIFTD